jgi:hypothetical protein
MARSFLPNQVSREEGEELDRFALARDKSCASRKGKRATGEAARDRHADGGVHGSAAKKQRKGESFAATLNRATGAP